MKGNIKKFDLELYSGTYKYYVKYRPSIPKEVIDIIVEHFDVKPTDRVLDLGCGTGQVALAMDGRCGEMVCLDPDPEMLKWAKKMTQGCTTKLIWLNYAAEDLGKIKKKLGIFKLATICRAFNWMEQDIVLNELNDLISEEGGVAIFGDKSFWTGEEEWQQAVKKVIQKYLGKERRAGKGTFKASEEPWEKILARSAFRFVKIHDVSIIRYWNVESIIGYLFSTSFAAPRLFGNQLDKFKEEVKRTLLSLHYKGVFREDAVWTIITGSKKFINSSSN
jgi:ubiquinone/menaquinone biosynthesis C-methylase UbiE